MAITEKRDLGEILKAGVTAGVIGGLLMAMYAMIDAAAKGMGFFAPLKMIGATFVGPSAMEGGAGILLWGLVLHMMVAATFGVIFAALLKRETTWAVALPAGVIYALAIAVLMAFVVVPITNQVMQEGLPMMWATYYIEHIFFGVGVSLAPLFRRRFVRGAPTVRRPVHA